MKRASRPAAPRHVIVWKEQAHFGGWPANRGIWSWGDEILVGFHTGFLKIGAQGHPIDPTRPTHEMFGRSLDGGETWSCERFDPQPPGEAGLGPDGLDFTHPNFAMTVRGSAFYFSHDRGHRWTGPIELPSFGHLHLESRTDYLVDGPHACTAFLSADKSNGKEGRPLCVRTTDGGRTWQMLSWIGPEPAGYAIMPASMRLSPTRLLSIIRQQDPGPEGAGLPGRGWFPVYVSDDNGQTWSFFSIAAEVPYGNSNPPSLVRLDDGRLCMAYGYRACPCGMRARFSRDAGKTWGEEVILRQDAGNWDIGYARSVLRPDGKIVTIYYYNDHPEGERYIAATTWDPNWAAPRMSLAGPSTVRLADGRAGHRLEVKTDRPAECRYAKESGLSFGRMRGRFDQTGGTTHTATLARLADGSITDFCIDAVAADGSQTAEPLKLTVAVIDPAAPPVYLRLALREAKLTAPMALAPAEGAAPAGYLATSADDAGAADFAFRVLRAGTYIIWGWVFGHSWHEDSFMVAMDDGPADHYDLTENGTLDLWHWCAVNGRNGVQPQALNPRTFKLVAGPHKLHIRGREKNARLGGLIITDDPYFIPDGPAAALPTEPRGY